MPAVKNHYDNFVCHCPAHAANVVGGVLGSADPVRTRDTLIRRARENTTAQISSQR